MFALWQASSPKTWENSRSSSTRRKVRETLYYLFWKRRHYLLNHCMTTCIALVSKPEKMKRKLTLDVAKEQKKHKNKNKDPHPAVRWVRSSHLRFLLENRLILACQRWASVIKHSKEGPPSHNLPYYSLSKNAIWLLPIFGLTASPIDLLSTRGRFLATFPS